MSVMRLLVVRPAAQAEALSVQLRAIGCEPIEVPAIEIVPPASLAALDYALRHLGRYAWIIATSRNAVDAFFDRLRRVDGRLSSRTRWAAVGPGTAGALTTRGVAQVWTPSRFTSDVLARELPARPGQRVLRLRAEVAAEIGATLRERGLDVDEVAVYRTVEAPAASVPRLAEAWRRGVDGVILTSASTVRGFLRLAEAAGIRQEIGRCMLLAIGPVTATAAREAGVSVDLVAEDYSVTGIVSALQRRVQDGH